MDELTKRVTKLRLSEKPKTKNPNTNPNTNPNPENPTMAQANPVPEHPYTPKDITQPMINIIPLFDGNPQTLPVYVESCEFLIHNYANLNDPTDPINSFIMRIVQSRLTGKALQLIGSRGKLTTWRELKALLELNFADQRSEKCLLSDLIHVKPERGLSPYNFGNKCKDTLNLLLTKVKQTETEERTVLKTQMYAETALETYLKGLMHYGKLGDKVRFRNPQNLETAMAYVIEEENFLYSIGAHANLNIDYKHQKQILPNQTKNNQPQQLFYPKFKTQNQPIYQPIYPRYQIPQQYWKPQQTFSKPNNPPQQRPQSFKFMKSPGQLQEKPQKPTPMEIASTTRKHIPQSRHHQPTNRPNWIREELHLQEQDEYLEQDENYEQDEYEFQPLWDEDTEPLPWEANEEAQIPEPEVIPPVAPAAVNFCEPPRNIHAK